MRVLIFSLLLAMSASAQPALYLIETNAIPQVVEVDQIGVVTNESGGLTVGTNRVLFTNLVYTLNLIRTNPIPFIVGPTGIGEVWGNGSSAEIAAPVPDGIPTGKWSEIVSAVIAAIAAAVYHLYRQHKNQQVNASLVQGIETGKQVIKSTPDGEAAMNLYKDWLVFQQRSKGVQSEISKLVEKQDPNDLILAEQAAETIVKDAIAKNA